MIRRTSCIIARTGDACRNLAIEKHLMDTLPDSTAILFLHQSRYAITTGRNQNPWYECNVEAFLESGGTLTKRLTGSGAMYADEGVLGYSLILPKDDFSASRQLAMLAHALQQLGAAVQPGPCASLTTGGKRLCLNAFHKAGATAIHDGCIFINADQQRMGEALLPGGKRLKGQTRPSIASLYTNLNEHLPPITIEAVQEALYRSFTAIYGHQPVWLDEQMLDEASIQKTAATFADPLWVYPEALPYNFSVDESFPWGNVTVLLQRENGMIKAARIFTDAMESPLFDLIQQALTGCPYLIGAISMRFQQRLGLLKDPRLLQIAGDICTLICGRIRALDRQGGGS